MVCAPTARLAAGHDAFKLVTGAAPQPGSVVLPSVKLTLPPAAAFCVVIVAVSVVLCPCRIEAGEAVSAIELDACCTVSVKLCVASGAMPLCARICMV